MQFNSIIEFGHHLTQIQTEVFDIWLQKYPHIQRPTLLKKINFGESPKSKYSSGWPYLNKLSIFPTFQTKVCLIETKLLDCPLKISWAAKYARADDIAHIFLLFWDLRFEIAIHVSNTWKILLQLPLKKDMWELTGGRWIKFGEVAFWNSWELTLLKLLFSKSDEK